MRRCAAHGARALLRAAWLALALAAAGTAAAGHEPVAVHALAERVPLAGAVRYLEDPARALSVEQAAAAAARFRPTPFHAADINFGYSRSAYWLALSLRVAPHAPARWLLEVGYPSLDRVEVYAPRAGGGYERQVAGDLQPFSERPFPHRHLVFPVALAPGETQTLYLRVTSEGNLTVPLTLWRAEALQRHDQRNYALLALYYGMLLALGLYNLLLYFSTRDRVFAAYVAFVAAMAVGQASMNGFGNQFAWPDWPAWGNVALPSGMSAAGLFGAVFTRAFLETATRFPHIDRLMLALATAFALSALSPLLVSYQFAAIFTSINGIAFSAAAVAAGVYAWLRGHPGARYFLLAWTLLLIGVAVLAMRNLGWIPTTTLTLHSMQIGSALEMLLLSFALAERINVIRREKEIAQQAMMNVLVRSERELEGRVAERTRELEQANRRLREKESALEHLAQHDALTGLANRILFDDRLQRAIARAQRNKSGVGLLMVDLDGFKAINDAHGHAVGDQLLQAVAGRLLDCVRGTDTVARLGGDEFMVVLEDLPGRELAARIADKLVRALNRPIELEPGPLRVGASVGVAHYPLDAGNAEMLMEVADAAMYAAKAGGRNRWRMAAAG